MLYSKKPQSGILPSTEDWDSDLTEIQSLDWEGLFLACTQSASLSKEENQVPVC